MTSALIRKLTLTNFRSYRAASVTADAQMVVLTGPNGAGKTNMLEAISFLAPGRGLRRATLEEVAFAEGNGSWAVSAEVEGELGLATLGTGIEASSGEEAPPQRQCRIDREPMSSADAFADHLKIVWLTPAMDALFNGPASERRRFLDRLVLAVDAEHSSRVSALERSLRSRNRLLEDPRPDPHWLDAVEHETAELAVAVAAMRAETVRRLQAVLAARQAQPSAFPAACARPSSGRSRGSIPRDTARESCARCAGWAHAGRAASHRPCGDLCAEANSRVRRIDRRAESAADRAGADACRAT
jgi:DNA replication and repair protein RecF